MPEQAGDGRLREDVDGRANGMCFELDGPRVRLCELRRVGQNSDVDCMGCCYSEKGVIWRDDNLLDLFVDCNSQNLVLVRI